jgi:tRNA pseudouridine38-40 synthase
VTETAPIRIKLMIEYDGSEFLGWQVQRSGRTVQGVIEAALQRVYHAPIRVQGSGRTDTGVHALGQVAHYDAPHHFDVDNLPRSLNHFLPPDVRIHEACSSSPDFHARFSALWRWYRYRVFLQVRAVERNYGWWPQFDLDFNLLRECAASLLGEHDFTTFAQYDPELSNYTCNVWTAEWLWHEDELHFHITANRFLRHMVRSLVGTMLDVARERFTIDDFTKMLHNPDKNQPVYTAPASGLCLMRVGYGDFPKLDDNSQMVQTFPFGIHIT